MNRIRLLLIMGLGVLAQQSLCCESAKPSMQRRKSVELDSLASLMTASECPDSYKEPLKTHLEKDLEKHQIYVHLLFKEHGIPMTRQQIKDFITNLKEFADVNSAAQEEIRRYKRLQVSADADESLLNHRAEHYRAALVKEASEFSDKKSNGTSKSSAKMAASAAIDPECNALNALLDDLDLAFEPTLHGDE